MRSIHRLIHHRRHMFGLMQYLLSEYAIELDEGERFAFEDTLKVFLNDHEWITKVRIMFII